MAKNKSYKMTIPMIEACLYLIQAFAENLQFEPHNFSTSEGIISRGLGTRNQQGQIVPTDEMYKITGHYTSQQYQNLWVRVSRAAEEELSFLKFSFSPDQGIYTIVDATNARKKGIPTHWWYNDNEPPFEAWASEDDVFEGDAIGPFETRLTAIEHQRANVSSAIRPFAVRIIERDR